MFGKKAKKIFRHFSFSGNSFPGKRSAPSKFRTRSAADADVSAPSITPDASPEYPAGAFERTNPRILARDSTGNAPLSFGSLLISFHLRE